MNEWNWTFWLEIGGEEEWMDWMGWGLELIWVFWVVDDLI